MEARDLKDGSISAAEQARLKALENKTSQDIYQQKHDAQLGNPDSKSSERMQADVQRNVNQQQRIQNGIDNGSLTNREVGALERGQSHVDRDEANAAANGRDACRRAATRAGRRESPEQAHVSQEAQRSLDGLIAQIACDRAGSQRRKAASGRPSLLAPAASLCGCFRSGVQRLARNLFLDRLQYCRW